MNMPEKLDVVHKPHFLGDGVFSAWPPHPKLEGTAYIRADKHEVLLSALRESTALLVRYRQETPLGNQPHMIAHKADVSIISASRLLEEK